MFTQEDIVKYKLMRHEDALNYTVFDAEHKVDTAHPLRVRSDGTLGPGVIPNSHLFPTSNGFQNATLKELERINEILGQDPDMGSYKFIELGSGKGRVILHNLASNAPYSSYVGVEIDPSLHDIAKNNMMTTSIEINKSVEFVNQDILEYKIPDEPCVIYLFYSFSKDLFPIFIEKNIDVINKNGSYLVLLSPQDYDLNKVVDKELIFSDISIYIYK
jgi:hypothetical protein